MIIDLRDTRTAVERVKRSSVILDDKKKAEYFVIVNFLPRIGKRLENVVIQLQEHPDAVVYDRVSRASMAIELTLVFNPSVAPNIGMMLWRLKRQFLEMLHEELVNRNINETWDIEFRGDEQYGQPNLHITATYKLLRGNQNRFREIAQGLIEVRQRNANVYPAMIHGAAIGIGSDVIRRVQVNASDVPACNENWGGVVEPVDLADIDAAIRGKEGKRPTYTNTTIQVDNVTMDSANMVLLVHTDVNSIAGLTDFYDNNGVARVTHRSVFDQIYFMPMWGNIHRIA